LVAGDANIFGANPNKIKDEKGLINQLYQQIGQLKVEKDFLEKCWSGGSKTETRCY